MKNQNETTMHEILILNYDNRFLRNKNQNEIIIDEKPCSDQSDLDLPLFNSVSRLSGFYWCKCYYIIQYFIYNDFF